MNDDININKNMIVNVLVMDDVVMVRERIVSILSDISSIGPIVQTGDTQSAVDLIAQYQPKVIVLDIQVPGTNELRNGIDVLKWARKHYPSLWVIMLSNFDSPRYREACTQAGAVHFFDKSREFEQLSKAVRNLLADVLDPDVISNP